VRIYKFNKTDAPVVRPDAYASVCFRLFLTMCVDSDVLLVQHRVWIRPERRSLLMDAVWTIQLKLIVLFATSTVITNAAKPKRRLNAFNSEISILF
jgi:hypothetical protein